MCIRTYLQQFVQLRSLVAIPQRAGHAVHFWVCKKLIVFVIVCNQEEAVRPRLHFGKQIVQVLAYYVGREVAEHAERKEVVEIVIPDLGERSVQHHEIANIVAMPNVLPELVPFGRYSVEANDLSSLAFYETLRPRATPGSDRDRTRAWRVDEVFHRTPSSRGHLPRRYTCRTEPILGVHWALQQCSLSRGAGRFAHPSPE